MRVVRRHDRDRVDRIGAPRFLLQHFGDVAVASRRVEAKLRSGRARAFRVARKHAGNDAPPAIELGRGPMRLADPHARSAADDAEAQRASEALSQLFFIHCRPFSVRSNAAAPIFAESLDVPGQIRSVARPPLASVRSEFVQSRTSIRRKLTRQRRLYYTTEILRSD